MLLSMFTPIVFMRAGFNEPGGDSEYFRFLFDICCRLPMLKKWGLHCEFPLYPVKCRHMIENIGLRLEQFQVLYIPAVLK